MRKIIRVDDLPLGFIYFTKTHIVEGTGKNYNEKVIENEGLHQEKRGKMVLHCRYWERSQDGKEETKIKIGI